MNLNMIGPKTKTEGLLLSITKNCETLIEQTHRKAEETLEFRMIKPRETFHFNPPIQNKGEWMIGLTDLEVYNSIFNITEENNKFKLYKYPDRKSVIVSYEKVRDEIEKVLHNSYITANDLQDETIAPTIATEYREQGTRRMKDDKYMRILAIYVNSIFQDSESFLRTEVDLVEDDVRLVLDEYNSSFNTYILQSGIYTLKDIFDALLGFLQLDYPGPKNIIDIEIDDITRKSKLVVRGGIIAIRFDEKSFFSTFLGFKPYWDYKNYNEYISQKNINLSSTNKIHLKFDVIDGSVVSGLRQPILYSFVLDKLPVDKVFSEPETIHFKKINKSVLNTLTFYSEDDNNDEVDFNGETFTFTLQMIKI